MFAVSRIGLRIFSAYLFCIGSFAMAEPAGEKAQTLINTFKFPETAILAEAMLCEELAARLGSEKHAYWRDKVDEETAMMLSEETAKYIAESVPPVPGARRTPCPATSSHRGSYPGHTHGDTLD